MSLTPTAPDIHSDAPPETSAPATPPVDYNWLARKICDTAFYIHLWQDRTLTTPEFRYAARRDVHQVRSAQWYRAELETYLPHFLYGSPPPKITEDYLNTLALFIRQCAACFSYYAALDHKYEGAHLFDKATDRAYTLRWELTKAECRREELQDELAAAEEEEGRLRRECEALEKKGKEEAAT